MSIRFSQRHCFVLILSHKGMIEPIVNEVYKQHCSTAWGNDALRNATFLWLQAFLGEICTCSFGKIPQDPKNASFFRFGDHFQLMKWIIGLFLGKLKLFFKQHVTYHPVFILDILWILRRGTSIKLKRSVTSETKTNLKKTWKKSKGGFFISPDLYVTFKKESFMEREAFF